MIAGHFGFAAAVKARATQTPLWALMLACQWLDVVFVPLFLLGVERIEPVEGGGYGKVIIHADWTHSLVGAVVLSVLLGVCWRGRTAVVIAAVSFSHWVLDLIVHRADMPILPGHVLALPRLGFGLWEEPELAVLVELALVVLGAQRYWHAALATGARRDANLAATVVLASGLLTLALNVAGF